MGIPHQSSSCGPDGCCCMSLHAKQCFVLNPPCFVHNQHLWCAGQPAVTPMPDCCPPTSACAVQLA